MDINGMNQMYESLGISREVREFAAETEKAVSYTHLDVYKRQSLMNAYAPGIWHSLTRLGGCPQKSPARFDV